MTAPHRKEASYVGLSALGFHRLVYDDWGTDPTGDRTVICVHGLTRTGRDFDWLARALADQGYRVVTPDVVGRGRSDWLSNADLYGYPQYMADLTALIARLGVSQVDWIGTSMGGLIGMMMTALPKCPVRRLVINDVGPLIPKASLERIRDYVGQDASFRSLNMLEAYLRMAYEPFGPLTDDQWRHLAETGHRTRPDGTLGRNYDPGIAKPFHEGPIADVDLWSVWDAIATPTLLLRGETSDLLLPETAEEMTRRGPKAKLVEIPGCGHAPALMADDQIAVIADWLAAA